jgi:hypothetical protein
MVAADRIASATREAQVRRRVKPMFGERFGRGTLVITSGKLIQGVAQHREQGVERLRCALR